MRIQWRSGSLQRTRVQSLRWVLAASMLASTLGLVAQASAQELDITVGSVADLSGLNAVVAHSDDGVNFRSEPGIGSDVIDTLPDGTVVTLRVDKVDTVVDDDARWWPVTFDGQDGWIAGFFLETTDQDASSSDDSTDNSESLTTPDFSEGDFVAVQTDTGDGLAMRAGPSTSEDRLAGLGEGDVVQIMDGPVTDDNGDGWYLITDGDISAYVFGAYLTSAGDLDVEADSVSGDGSTFSSGDVVAPAPGTDGVFVRSRASVNARKLGSLQEGQSIKVIEGPDFDKAGDPWYIVDFGGESGYMFGNLLVSAESVELLASTGPTGTFIYPLQSYTFTQAYGCTGYSFEPWNAQLGCSFHNGIDLAAPAYTPLLAADGGTVVTAGWCDCGLGFYVEIDHGNGFSTVYGHMAEQPYVSAGQSVNQGDVIGPIGSTGFSTGPHVHFMLKLNGVTVDPLGYL